MTDAAVSEKRDGKRLLRGINPWAAAETSRRLIVDASGQRRAGQYLRNIIFKLVKQRIAFAIL